MQRFILLCLKNPCLAIYYLHENSITFYNRFCLGIFMVCNKFIVSQSVYLFSFSLKSIIHYTLYSMKYITMKPHCSHFFKNSLLDEFNNTSFA